MELKELIIRGTKSIEGKEVKIVEGGFGENQKCLLASDIAVMHEIENPNDINKLINNNIERFNDNDLIDFLNDQQSLRDFAKENGLITNNRTKNIFLLSERGYTKLVAMMSNNNEKKWFVMDKLIDEYFAMREVITSDEQLKKELAYKLLNGGIESIEAHKKLLEIETKEVKQKAIEATVQALKPTVDMVDKLMSFEGSFDIGTVAKVLGIKDMGRNKLFAYLKENSILKDDNEPYQSYIEYFEVKFIPKTSCYGKKYYPKTLINAKGIKFLMNRLIKDGYLMTKTTEQIIEELNINK